MLETSKQSHLDKIYFESYNSTTNFNEFVSTKNDIYSQSSKYHGESLNCENLKLLSKQLKKGNNGNETHGLIQWTCKKCPGCIKYKQMAREHKIEDKFIDNPEIDIDDLWILTINLDHWNKKVPYFTNRIKYLIKKNSWDVDLLLYALTNNTVSYLIRGYLDLELQDSSMIQTWYEATIDFFGPLATKFLGPFYGNKRVPKITTVGNDVSTCMCGKLDTDHKFVLTNEDEICYTMTAIPEYEEGFEKFKKMLLPPPGIQTKLEDI